jgi:apolipoprotein D and lipocalin family protein
LLFDAREGPNVFNALRPSLNLAYLRPMTPKIARFLLALLLCQSMAAIAWERAGDRSADLALETVPSVDLTRYLGRWYEIAKFPNRFQKQCVADTSAQYSVRADGNIQVLNRCQLANGKMDEAIGVARQLGPANSPKLEVRFAPAWLSFIPAVWGNYWIVDLDPDYQLVAVSEPKREFLWILSRSPKLARDEYFALLARLRAKGLDTNRLETTQQSVSKD